MKELNVEIEIQNADLKAAEERIRQYMNYAEYRNALGKKDANIAKETGINRSTFSDWKSGRSAPKGEKLKKIAYALGITVETLLGEEPKEEKQTWYTNDETAKIAQEVFENPKLRVLFDAARDSSPEDIQMAVDLLSRFKRTNPNG